MSSGAGAPMGTCNVPTQTTKCRHTTLVMANGQAFARVDRDATKVLSYVSDRLRRPGRQVTGGRARACLPGLWQPHGTNPRSMHTLQTERRDPQELLHSFDRFPGGLSHSVAL
jgi:hypothetical protein